MCPCVLVKGNKCQKCRCIFVFVCTYVLYVIIHIMTDRKKQSTVNCNSHAILPMVNCPKAIRISLSLTQCNLCLNSLCNCVTLKLRCLEIRYFLFLSNLNICQSQKQKQKGCPYKIQFLICIINTSNWQLATGDRLP